MSPTHQVYYNVLVAYVSFGEKFRYLRASHDDFHQFTDVYYLYFMSPYAKDFTPQHRVMW